MRSGRLTVGRTGSAVVSAVLFLFFSVPPAPAADADSLLLAVGAVDGATGDLTAVADAIGASSVTSSRLSTGHYEIRIEKAGLLFLPARNRFLVQVTPAGLADTAIAAQATWATTGGGRTLVLTVRTDNVEDIAFSLEDDPLPADADFFFGVFLEPPVPAASAGQKFYLAAGSAGGDGMLRAGVAAAGVAIETGRARRVTGDYRVDLRKTGAFAGAAPEDFVLLLTVDGEDTGDALAKGLVETVTDDLVSVRIRTDDAQADPAVSLADPEPEDRAFHFTLYRIPAVPAAEPVRARLLVAAGEVAPDGTLAGGGLTRGGTLASALVGPAHYEVSLRSPGAFAGRSPSSFVLQMQVRGGASSDVAVNGRVVSVDPDEVVVRIRANDVETAGEAEGAPAVLATGSSLWQGIAFSLLDTVPDRRPDLRIGRSPAPPRQAGNNRYGAVVGQTLRLRLRGLRAARFHFSVENDGTLDDTHPVRASGIPRPLRFRCLMLRPPRGNVTAALRSTRGIRLPQTPGGIALFQGTAQYRTRSRRPRSRILLRGASIHAPVFDSASVLVLPVPPRRGR